MNNARSDVMFYTDERLFSQKKVGRRQPVPCIKRDGDLHKSFHSGGRLPKEGAFDHY
jgi:hypothetical protein